MRFEIEVVTRVLPFSEPEILRSVVRQLQTGTIINVVPLGEFINYQGIEVKVRRLIEDKDCSDSSSDSESDDEDEDDSLTYYTLTNDERRRLIKCLHSHNYF